MKCSLANLCIATLVRKTNIIKLKTHIKNRCVPTKITRAIEAYEKDRDYVVRALQWHGRIFGGFVRDYVSGDPPNDIDLLVGEKPHLQIMVHRIRQRLDPDCSTIVLEDYLYADGISYVGRRMQKVGKLRIRTPWRTYDVDIVVAQDAVKLDKSNFDMSCNVLTLELWGITPLVRDSNLSAESVMKDIKKKRTRVLNHSGLNHIFSATIKRRAEKMLARGWTITNWQTCDHPRCVLASPEAVAQALAERRTKQRNIDVYAWLERQFEFPCPDKEDHHSRKMFYKRKHRQRKKQIKGYKPKQKKK